MTLKTSFAALGAVPAHSIVRASQEGLHSVLFNVSDVEREGENFLAMVGAGSASKKVGLCELGEPSGLRSEVGFVLRLP